MDTLLDAREKELTDALSTADERIINEKRVALDNFKREYHQNWFCKQSVSEYVLK